ncbi:MAG: DNA repair protein RecO [Planctomycetia bacterium]|nr:DNA repair protein RecO [Planctomycetia bacterium]
MAIVLRTVPFGDSSCVVTLFSREHGKLRALAKGAWRPKSGFDAALDLLSICQVLVLRKSSGGLDLVTEACLEHRFRVGRSQAAFLGGMDVAELLDTLTADGDPQPELFDVARSALRTLSAPRHGHTPDTAASPLADATVRALVTHAELAILRLTGHGPALLRCAACGGAVGTAGRIAFGMLDGGVLCQACRGGKRAVVSLTPDGLAALRLLAGTPDAWRSLALPPAVDAEVRAVMNTFLSHLLGRRPRVACPAGGTGRCS